MPVRIGTPQSVVGLSDIVNNPIYATGVGLLHYGAKRQRQSGKRRRKGSSNSGESGWSKLKSWFQGGV